MKNIILVAAVGVFLSGCLEEKYRYKCQNPDQFHAPECQKPRCMFTQTCPEYLVAPILEKKVDEVKPNN